MQPYNGGDKPDRHWLAMVGRMWNVDKHRLLHPTFALAWVGKTAFVPHAIDADDLFAGVEIENVVPEGASIAEGAEIAHIRFTAGQRPQMQKASVKTQPPAHVAFGTGSDTCSLRTVGDFCASAWATLDSLDALFQSG